MQVMHLLLSIEVIISWIDWNFAPGGILFGLDMGKLFSARDSSFWLLGAGLDVSTHTLLEAHSCRQWQSSGGAQNLSLPSLSVSNCRKTATPHSSIALQRHDYL